MSESKNQEFFNKVYESGRKKKISRRQFMTHSMAAGLSLSAASTLWTENVSAQTPQKGGTFKVGVHDASTADKLDPGTYSSGGDIQTAHTHRSYLTEVTSDNGLGPDLATSWEASPDAKTWTFELAKEASFHSGKAVTSEDVVATINHHRGEKTTSAAATLMGNVTDVKADGDHAVVIELDTGVADLPWYFTDYHMAVCPSKEDGSIDWESGDGSGPYKLNNFDAGVRMDFERHDGWHREGAYFDAVEFSILSDPNARQTALITGDVDSVTSVDVKTLALLQRNADIAIDNIPSGSALTMPMFCDVAPFDNVDVRLALKHAINREEIVEKILFGTGIPGNDFHVSPNMPYFPDSIEQRKYDPDKANFHLKKAGMDSLSVDLSAADGVMPGAIDMCVLYGESAKKAGININTVREPNDGFWSDVWLKKSFLAAKWGGRGTPDQILSIAYKDDAPWNESHWKNDRFNELLLQAKSELDENLRAEMYHEMCLISRDDGGTIIPIFVNYVYGRRSNVQHGESVAASWENDGARAAQRWWFAS